MKVFIAGLPLEVDEAELTAVFGDFGPVKSLRIIKDRETKESKGFGFVEMVNEDEAKEAIRCMQVPRLFYFYQLLFFFNMLNKLQIFANSFGFRTCIV